jgi:hypothetical protein
MRDHFPLIEHKSKQTHEEAVVSIDTWPVVWLVTPELCRTDTTASAGVTGNNPYTPTDLTIKAEVYSSYHSSCDFPAPVLRGASTTTRLQ